MPVWMRAIFMIKAEGSAAGARSWRRPISGEIRTMLRRQGHEVLYLRAYTAGGVVGRVDKNANIARVGLLGNRW